MTLNNLWGQLMALIFPIPKKERRKNRQMDIQTITPSNVKMMAALAKIANMTLKEMPDDSQFREWAQRVAHESIGRVVKHVD